MPRRILFALLAAATGCNGPWSLLPGGELDGPVEPPPSDWSTLGEYGTAQLETRAEEPYSVNLAFTVMDGRVYVNAGGNETQWVKNMEAEPRVRLRVQGTLYELQAERVTDPGEIAAFARAWTSQSTFRRDPTGYPEVWIYRLGPR